MPNLVSILIPCYNVEQYLPKCLDSVINQSYRDLQIVLVDDGSKDNTLQIAQEYAAKDSRIEVYHQENAGVATARNLLLSKIKGDYFLFVDSDDWIESDMVEFLVGKAIVHNADMVTCGSVINGAEVKTDYIEKTYNQIVAVEHFLYHKEFRGMLWNKLCKSSLLVNRLRFNEDVSYGEDALFCWELLKMVNKVIFTDRLLYHYRMNENSLSHGSFGPKKMSAYIVWTTLTKETAKLYPQMNNIANARFCIESTLLLRDAAHSGYKDMEVISTLQNTVKTNWKYLNEVNITSPMMKLYAFLACRSYWIAGEI